MNTSTVSDIRIGWASTDLTPTQPVILAGQMHARVSEDVLDPVTATVLALESSSAQAVLVSCDFATIPEDLRDKVRSPAVQTFIVQLAGTGTYVPNERAVAGKSYGSIPASNPVGPDGGRKLVNETLKLMHQVWDDQ